MNQGYLYRREVQAPDSGTRVLAYHAQRFAHSTLEEWRRMIEAGRVLLNGTAAACDQALAAGDVLEFHRAPWVEPAAPLEFRVVHEDADLLVVDKPAGLQVLPAGPFLESTLLHLVRGSSAERAASAPVHRLGRGSSGLVLFGKHGAARARLSEQLRQFRITKTYLARVRGTALPLSCIARQPIGPRAHGPMRVFSADPGGKRSVTRLRVLVRDHFRGESLVAAQPITGRPDQIRIHLAACGAPLVGDPLFGVGGVPISDARPGEGGYWLHATGLSFRHPATGELLKLRSRPGWLEAGLE